MIYLYYLVIRGIRGKVTTFCVNTNQRIAKSGKVSKRRVCNLHFVACMHTGTIRHVDSMIVSAIEETVVDFQRVNVLVCLNFNYSIISCIQEFATFQFKSIYLINTEEMFIRALCSSIKRNTGNLYACIVLHLNIGVKINNRFCAFCGF